MSKYFNIDRRYLWIIFFIILAIPIKFPLGLPLTISPKTQSAYNFIESLSQGSVVVLNPEFQIAMQPDVLPGTIAIAQHCLNRGLKILWAPFSQAAVANIESAMSQVNIPSGAKYGIDWVILPFLPGAEVGKKAFAENIFSIVSTDKYGDALSGLDMMKTVTSAKNFALYVGMSDGFDTCAGDIRQFFVTYNVPVIINTTTGTAATVAPYWPSQTIGLLTGSRSGAEYEKLIGKPGRAILALDAQSTAHLTMAASLIIGNIIYFFEKGKGRKK